jgi:DNA invertase Pin-like site-specific DNA recombinase
MKIKAALYARVSLKDGRQDVDNQLRLLREYVEREGLQVVKEYVDHSTGGNGNRDQFRAMFDAAAKRRFSILLFFHSTAFRGKERFRPFNTFND